MSSDVASDARYTSRTEALAAWSAAAWASATPTSPKTPVIRSSSVIEPSAGVVAERSRRQERTPESTTKRQALPR